MSARLVNPMLLVNNWMTPYTVSLPPIGELVTDIAWEAPLTPNDRIFETLGSYAYRTGMTLLDRNLNIMKKSVIAGHRFWADEKFWDTIALVGQGDVNAAREILTKCQNVSTYILLNGSVYQSRFPHLNYLGRRSNSILIRPSPSLTI